jgi:chaperonin GroES
MRRARSRVDTRPTARRPTPKFTPNDREIRQIMASKVRPLHNRIIVQRIKEEEKTAGGIIIPDTAKEKPTEGRVIAAGPGRRDEKGNLIAMDVKKGDRVLFSKYSGNEVNLDGEEHLIISEDDVLAILE